MLGVKEEEEEEEEELIVAVAVATARIIMCARYVSAFARYNRYYIDIPDWIKRGPLKERECDSSFWIVLCARYSL